MKKVRWAVLGTGNIANKFANAVKNAEGAEFVAVASRKLETAQQFAKKHNVGMCFSSYEELAKSPDVDAVYIAVPHTYHAFYSKFFVNAGKHVLCEKPVTVNGKELKELQDLVEEKNAFMMEGLWTRFLPAIAKAKSLVDSGVIGDVLEISADFCYNCTDRTDIVFDPKCGGGSLLDIGIYGINFASIFLGDDVVDIKHAAFVNENVDERLNFLLSYRNGAIARISSAITLDKPANAYVYGSKGYIFVPNFYGACEFELFVDGKSQKYSVPYKGNGFEEEIEESNRCILSGKKQSDIMPLSQSAITMEIMDRIRKEIGVVYEND